MIHYTLSPFRTDPIRGNGYFVPPANAIGSICLRSLPGHTSTDFMFAALDDSISPVDADDRVFATAESPVHNLSIAVASKDRTAWADALGVTLGGGIATLADLLAATFLVGDPEGQTALKPLLPNGDQFEIHLGGHSLVWSRRTGKGDAKDPFLAKALACKSADIKRIADATLRGKLITDALHKAGLPIDKETAKNALGIDEEPQKRQTSYSDDFNRANNAALGGNWSEPESDGWSISSNTALAVDNISDNVGRYDQDVSSADHIAKCTLSSAGSVNGGVGPTCRHSSSAETFYYSYHQPNIDASSTWKQVAGSHTQVGSTTTEVDSVPDTMSLRAAGSTITRYHNDISEQANTDSSISAGTRGGIYQYGWNGAIDDWSIDDEVVAGGQPFRKRWGGVPHNGYSRRGVW